MTTNRFCITSHRELKINWSVLNLRLSINGQQIRRWRCQRLVSVRGLAGREWASDMWQRRWANSEPVCPLSSLSRFFHPCFQRPRCVTRHRTNYKIFNVRGLKFGNVNIPQWRCCDPINSWKSYNRHLCRDSGIIRLVFTNSRLSRIVYFVLFMFNPSEYLWSAFHWCVACGKFLLFYLNKLYIANIASYSLFINLYINKLNCPINLRNNCKEQKKDIESWSVLAKKMLPSRKDRGRNENIRRVKEVDKKYYKHHWRKTTEVVRTYHEDEWHLITKSDTERKKEEGKIQTKWFKYIQEAMTALNL